MYCHACTVNIPTAGKHKDGTLVETGSVPALPVKKHRAT